MQNRQFRLAKRPFGLPTRDTWEQTTEEVREILEGEILVKINYISLDPAMRGWMNDAKSYIAPVGIGEVMRADTVGEVIASKNPHFAVGEYVNYAFGTQEYGICNGKGVRKIDVNLAELPIYLGALGMAGMTAYFGILNVGKAATRTNFPTNFKLFDANLSEMQAYLNSSLRTNPSSIVLSLPNAEGAIEEFEIKEASNFDPQLQSTF
ncbi:MAG: hypothetical protein EAZ20_15820, partial [Bacteroidetes bacterium]